MWHASRWRVCVAASGCEASTVPRTTGCLLTPSATRGVGPSSVCSCPSRLWAGTQLDALASWGWLSRLLAAVRARNEPLGRPGPTARQRCACVGRPTSPTDAASRGTQAELDQRLCEQAVPAALPGGPAAAERDADQEQQRRPLGPLLPAPSPRRARAAARAAYALHPGLPQGTLTLTLTLTQTRTLTQSLTLTLTLALALTRRAVRRSARARSR